MTGAAEALGGYRALPDGPRALSSFFFLVLACVVAFLERLQYRLRDQEPARWWASNGRDVVNVFALAVMTLGLWLLGFVGPLAFGIAASFIILLSACQGELERHPNAVLLSVLVAVALSAPILIVPARLAEGYRALVGVLFG